MGRPLIGLTTYAEPQRLSGRDIAAVSLPAGYVNAVLASGGQPILIPSQGVDEGILDDSQQPKLLEAESPAATQPPRIGARRGVERGGCRHPPIDDEQLVLLIANRATPEVVRRSTLKVDPPKTQRLRIDWFL